MFNPNSSFKILTDEEFKQNIDDITIQLKDCLHSGKFDGFDGKKIYYEYFLCQNATASVVIVHGLSEFTQKYYELAYYFLNSGYNVFLLDQRCHGFSERLTERIDLVHVDSFNDYVADLEKFIDNVVLHICNAPLYMYSHSMGGAVTTMYLSKNPNKIKKAVLSAPLFEPEVGRTPYPIAQAGTYLKMVFAGKKSIFNPAQKFNPEATIKKSRDESPNRFMHNLNLRQNEEHYQSTPMTTGWVHNSLHIYSSFKKNKTAEKIKTPILLISASNDGVVKCGKYPDFKQRCGCCEYMVIENTNHSMLTCSYKAITTYINGILDFYRR